MTSLFVPHQIPRSSLLDDAKLVLDCLDKHPKLDPRRCSRFAEMAKAVATGGENLIPASRSDFQIVIQANRDLLEFAFIFRVLKPTPENKTLWQRISGLFSDAALPSKSNRRSDSRNIQFELLCEAMLARSGLDPTHIPRDSPDFACRLGQWEFMAEAKLARSVNAMKRELIKAAGQIADSKKPGLIFLDWTFAVNSDNTDHFVAMNKPARHLGAVQNARYREVYRNELKRLEPELAAKRVLGVTYVDRLVFQDGIDPITGLGRWQLATFRDQQIILPRHVIGDGNLVETAFQLLAELGLPCAPERADESAARCRAAGIVVPVSKNRD